MLSLVIYTDEIKAHNLYNFFEKENYSENFTLLIIKSKIYYIYVFYNDCTMDIKENHSSVRFIHFIYSTGQNFKLRKRSICSNRNINKLRFTLLK